MIKAKAKHLKSDLKNELKEINEVQFLAKKIDLDANSIKTLAFELGSEFKNLFLVFGAETNGKAILTCYVSKEIVASKNLNAGTIVRELGKYIQGGGGGQAFFATAGGKNPFRNSGSFRKSNNVFGLTLIRQLLKIKIYQKGTQVKTSFINLQTHIPFSKNTCNPIDYNSKIFLLGSCFSDNIGQKLSYHKFQSILNPFGILFHPKAIETIIKNALCKKEYTEKDIFYFNERWQSFEAHSKLSSSSKEEDLEQLNRASDINKYSFKK